MEKIPLENDTPKKKLKERAADRIYRFSLDAGLRGHLVRCTRTGKEAAANHKTGPLETLVLTQVYIGALLMAAQLKQEGKVLLKIESGGPLESLSVEADNHGAVRGYLLHNPIDTSSLGDNFTMDDIIGPGFLNVIRLETGMKKPYSSQIMLRHGNFSKDLAQFSLESDQIPGLYRIETLFDDKGNLEEAAGLFLQALPEADEKTIIELEATLNSAPGPATLFKNGHLPEDALNHWFGKQNPTISENKRVEFFCGCTQKKFQDFMKNLKSKGELKQNEGETLTANCHFCNTQYHFSEEDLQ